MNKPQNQTEADPRRRSILTAIIGAPLLAAMPAATTASPSGQRWEDALIDFAAATKKLAVHPDTPEGHQYICRLILRRLKEVYGDEAEAETNEPTQPEPPHVFKLWVYATRQLLECPDTPDVVYNEITRAIDGIGNIVACRRSFRRLGHRRESWILDKALGLPMDEVPLQAA